MKYKPTLDDKGYIESLIHTGTDEDTVEANLEEIREHLLCCFKIVDGVAVYDPERYEEYLKELEKIPTWQEKVEAQMIYTAMMTDTLLEAGE